MEVNEYRELKNRKYTPKAVMEYLVISSDNITDKNIESLMNAFENELFRNMNNKDTFRKWDKVIENCWNLSTNQALAYAYLVFDALIFEEKDFLSKTIADMFVYMMKFHSPDNAEDLVASKLERLL